MARVLVTGASGFIGKRLVAALVDRGDDVTCLVQASSTLEPLLKLGARLITGDITRADTLHAAVAEVDQVYHLAGLTRAFDLPSFCRVNEDGVRNIVEACARRTTPPVVVLVSSLAAAGPTANPDQFRRESDPAGPVSNYGRSKRAGEIAAETRAADLPITIVRPPIVVGPGDSTSLSLFRGIKRFRSFFVVGPRQRFSIIHVADLANALIAAAHHGERLPPSSPGQNNSENNLAGQGFYFAAANEHITFGQLGRWIGRSIRRPYALAIPLPLFSIWPFAAIGELVGKIVRRPQYLCFDLARQLTAGHWICSSEKAARDLHFAPEAPLPERIAQTAIWYRENGWL
jgi:nucleoside-diphosphate-sugar epimerase